MFPPNPKRHCNGSLWCRGLCFPARRTFLRPDTGRCEGCELKFVGVFLFSSRRKRTQTEGSPVCAVGIGAPASVSTAGGTSQAPLGSAGNVFLPLCKSPLQSCAPSCFVWHVVQLLIIISYLKGRSKHFFFQAVKHERCNTITTLMPLCEQNHKCFNS